MTFWKRSEPNRMTPPSTVPDEWSVPDDFQALGDRARWLQRPTKQTDILPELDCDLEALKSILVEADDHRPNVKRRSIEGQLELLRFEFKGQPALCFLNALTISYLRRNTAHNAKASTLFLRIWREHAEFMAKELSTRWIISSLQTFADYGESEHQRRAGTGGYIYGSFIRATEVEHGLSGSKPDDVYPTNQPRIGDRLGRIGGYKVGGTDMLLNLNAIMTDIAARDRTAGAALFELLRRVRDGDTLFSRMDETRIAKDIHLPPFENAWSFGDDPRLK